MTCYRAWINAPSTLQAAHEYHGMSVLVDCCEVAAGIPDHDYVRVYPTTGGIISMLIDKKYLSRDGKFNPNTF
jgi:hypothetical protein